MDELALPAAVYTCNAEDLTFAKSERAVVDGNVSALSFHREPRDRKTGLSNGRRVRWFYIQAFSDYPFCQLRCVDIANIFLRYLFAGAHYGNARTILKNFAQAVRNQQDCFAFG